MSDAVVWVAEGGQRVGAYVAEPKGKPKAAVLVLHEAFGVTPHIQSVCRGFAEEGYVAVAPHLYAWATGKERGVVLGQDKEGLDEGRRLIMATTKEQMLETARLAVAWAEERGLKLLVSGYCWGGSLAYLMASNVREIAACSSYYGGLLWEVVTWGQPECPRMIHLATLDRYIPLDKTVAAFEEYDPECEVFIYDADHGFNRHDGKTYDADAAGLAYERTLKMFAKALKN